MILRRKVCLGALLGGILFFMIATHTIQKGAILPAYIAASIGSTERMAEVPTTRTPTTTATTTATTASQVHTCSCPTCLADSGTSEWFDQHFDPKQQPYLISEENNLDPDSLKWWMVRHPCRLCSYTCWLVYVLGTFQQLPDCNLLIMLSEAYLFMSV